MSVHRNAPCQIDASSAECRSLKQTAKSGLLCGILNRGQYAEDGIIGKTCRYARKLWRAWPFVHGRARTSGVAQRTGREAVRRSGIPATGPSIDDAGVERHLRRKTKRARACRSAAMCEREESGRERSSSCSPLRSGRTLSSDTRRALNSLNPGGALNTGRALYPLNSSGALHAGCPLQALRAGLTLNARRTSNPLNARRAGDSLSPGLTLNAGLALRPLDTGISLNALTDRKSTRLN